MDARALLATFAVALAGCSGASPQLLQQPGEDAGATVVSSDPTGTTTPTTPTTPSSSSTGGTGDEDASTGPGSTGSTGSTGSSGSTTDDAGTSAGQGSGGGIDAGVAPAQCPAGGMMQVAGSGGSSSNPTPFSTVACGALAPGQSYFWTFRLPPSASKFGVSFTGGIRIQLTVDGNTVDVVPGANLPFRTRDPYLMQVTPAGSTAESYVIELIEK